MQKASSIRNKEFNWRCVWGWKLELLQSLLCPPLAVNFFVYFSPQIFFFSYLSSSPCLPSFPQNAYPRPSVYHSPRSSLMTERTGSGRTAIVKTIHTARSTRTPPTLSRPFYRFIPLSVASMPIPWLIIWNSFVPHHLSDSLPQSGRPIRSYPAVTPLWAPHRRPPTSQRHPTRPRRHHEHAGGWDKMTEMIPIWVTSSGIGVCVLRSWVRRSERNVWFPPGWHVSGLNHRPGRQPVPPAGGTAALSADRSTE